MKKLIILCLMTSTFFGFKNSKPNIYEGKLSKTQLGFVKDNYPWQDREFLIINFRQPIKSCHYNNYKNINSSTWFDEFYSKMKLEKISNIFVYSDSRKAKKKIDSKKHFEDKNDFFFNSFFSKDKTCYGVMIINQKGDYLQKNGEYLQSDITAFVSRL